MGHFTNHARDRAKDRYGIDLTDAELLDIYQQCATGKALLAKKGNGSNTYIAHCRGKTVVPLLNEDNKLIITFLPSDYFVCGQQMKFYQKTGKAKQKHTIRVSGNEYRRERITVAKALEDDQ